MINLTNLSVIVILVVNYNLRGQILQRQKLDCDSCIINLFKETSHHSYFSSTYGKFVNLRHNGGLIFGSESSFKIIMEAEKVLLYFTNNLTNINVPDLNEKNNV